MIDMLCLQLSLALSGKNKILKADLIYNWDYFKEETIIQDQG